MGLLNHHRKNAWDQHERDFRLIISSIGQFLTIINILNRVSEKLKFDESKHS